MMSRPGSSGERAAPPKPPFRVAVVGAGKATSGEVTRAEDLGRALAELGCAVITGGLGGVMAAASKGCRESGGLTVGFLPGTDPASGNPDLVFPLATGLGESRNALVVRTAEAVVAVGGEWGTLSEIALSKKMGRPVAALGEPTFDVGIEVLATTDEAVAWVRRRMEGRLNKPEY